MYQTDYDDFRKLLADLCTSVNRPFTDDLLRVFWEDLRAVPFGAVKARAAVLRVSGKTKFVSNDLRPSADDKPVAPIGAPSPLDLLSDFALKNYPLTPGQISGPWTWFGEEFDAPGIDGKMRYKHGVRITGVTIPADGDRTGYRITLADLQLRGAA